MRVVVAGLTLSLLAVPALAQDFTDGQKAIFIDTIAANDCSMTEDEAEELMPAAGIDRDTSGAIANSLIEGGFATLSDDMMILTLSEEICQ
jgi:hypothetical protein